MKIDASQSLKLIEKEISLVSKELDSPYYESVMTLQGKDFCRDTVAEALSFKTIKTHLQHSSLWEQAKQKSGHLVFKHKYTKAKVVFSNHDHKETHLYGDFGKNYQETITWHIKRLHALFDKVVQSATDEAGKIDNTKAAKAFIEEQKILQGKKNGKNTGN
ncbi:MAG: hypothetical protein FJZ58_05855 [Chlamydiae bacterium]|nr:hypothetical protein [Chlamydiota bacterium]